jgi:hypothetical protein
MVNHNRRFGAVCRGSGVDLKPLVECPGVSVWTDQTDYTNGWADYNLFVITGAARIDKIVFLIHFDANITTLHHVSMPFVKHIYQFPETNNVILLLCKSTAIFWSNFSAAIYFRLIVYYYVL